MKSTEFEIFSYGKAGQKISHDVKVTDDGDGHLFIEPAHVDDERQLWQVQLMTKEDGTLALYIVTRKPGHHGPICEQKGPAKVVFLTSAKQLEAIRRENR